MSGLGLLILQLISAAPSAISAITTFYQSVKNLLTPTDQQTIESVLAQSQAGDAAATAAADTALSAAAKK